MGRKNALISLTVFETKNEMRVHTRFARTCNIFRVSGVIVRMPYLPSRKVRWANSICEENVAQRFPSYFLFTQFSSSKSSLLLALRHPHFPDPSRFKNIQIRRWHWALRLLFVRNIRLVRSGYFFIRISIRIATGSTSESHPLCVNTRPIWIKLYPTLYLSDSHPLSVYCNPLLFRWSTIFDKAKIRRFSTEKISVAVGHGFGWTHRNWLLQNLGRDLI